MTTNYIAAEKKVRGHVDDAAEALANLNVYATIVTILEASLLSGSDARTAPGDKIIAICRKAMRAELKLHDAHAAKAVAAAREVPNG